MGSTNKVQDIACKNIFQKQVFQGLRKIQIYVVSCRVIIQVQVNENVSLFLDLLNNLHPFQEKGGRLLSRSKWSIRMQNAAKL